MIGHISGIVAAKTTEAFIITTQSGVGYEVIAKPTLLTITKENQNIELFIYTHVREQAITLFGFETLHERALFLIYLGISGIGPKTALAIVTHISQDELKTIIEENNTTLLSKIPGIGKKTAARIILELKDKFNITITQVSTQNNDALLALQNLGYSAEEAAEALSKTNATELEEQIKEALLHLV